MSLRWWAVYRGGEYIEHVLAASGERALEVVSERELIDRAELNAVHDAERFVLGLLPADGIGSLKELCMLPFFSQEIGPEFSDNGPTMRAVPWAQASERMEAQREPGPADPGKEVE